MEEQELKVSYSASNDKRVNAGEFEITIYQGLKSLMKDVVEFVEERIELDDITSFTITVKQ